VKIHAFAGDALSIRRFGRRDAATDCQWRFDEEQCHADIVVAVDSLTGQLAITIQIARPQ
jgi:hypothetical protein